MTTRITAIILLLLDVAAGFAVFNLISNARGANPAGILIVWPLLVPLGAFAAAIHLVQGYRQRTDMLSVDYASLHLIATLGAMLATLLLTFVVVPAGFQLQSSRAVIALSFLALVPLTLSYRRLIYLRAAAAHSERKIVFVGDARSRDAFREECRTLGHTQSVIFPILPKAEGTPHSDPPIASSDQPPFAAVLDELQAGRITVEAIVLRESAGDLEHDVAERLVKLYFAGVPTYTLELFHEVYWQKIPLYRLNQTWLFQEGFKIAREPVFERAKRASDIVLATLGLVGSFPLMVLAGAAIWIDDRGPVLFRQRRIGRNHAAFTVLKLRTMRAVTNGARYTQRGDSRITRVGRLLRATRLDELPQLWNVLLGDMSLIGPRAEWDELVEQYERQVPCYYFRHLVRPGITGWAQVNYPYGASLEDTQRKLEYDLYYVRHFSFRLDATIVLKTIHTMLFGRGR